MEEIEYLWICVATGVGTFLAWPHLENILGVDEADAWVDWGDALGVGAFCVIGGGHSSHAVRVENASCRVASFLFVFCFVSFLSAPGVYRVQLHDARLLYPQRLFTSRWRKEM